MVGPAASLFATTTRDGDLAVGYFVGELDLTGRSIPRASFIATGPDMVGGLGASLGDEGFIETGAAIGAPSAARAEEDIAIAEDPR